MRAESEVQILLIRQDLVHANVPAMGVRIFRACVHKVVCRSRLRIRSRADQQIHNFLGDRIYAARWNHVLTVHNGEWHTGRRWIVDDGIPRASRELASEFGSVGKRVDRGVAFPNSAKLHVTEEKSLVVNDRATDGAPELISPERGLGRISGGEVVLRIQRRVPYEFETFAMKFIGARFDRCADHA